MPLKLIVFTIIVLLESSNAAPTTEECTTKPSVCAPNGFCFKNSDNSSACQKSCPNGWKCNNGDIVCSIPVEKMIKEVAQIKQNDVVYGFALNQLCIARLGCEHKQSLDNPSWFDNILNAFIEPYVQKNGNWSDVIKQCHAQYSYIPILGKYLCQEKMAEYHITFDLKNAVNKNGCGTQRDWDTIGNFLVDCIKEAHIGIPFGESYAISEVFRNRNNVRETCMKTRQENGLQMVF
ncbi:unnamed protein product [Adineta steineri]|uniref:Uncharacterized protein n=1 Tax=Adineta steineri TaxID=433720 RepID=A0A813WHE1_9BILA|nr:unnamed protein product [Adineta steineri]CAF1115326.1 unnamed protein product [Adineta steineri]CAF3700218.1 unnamed protein product [Adineta steineri]CAF3779200.1 unnamed protein product [Adineta steineri]